MIKKIILTLIVLAGGGIAYLAIAGNKLQEIKTEIDIQAPPSKVWSIISNIDNWKDWSPIINDSQGVANVGSELSITMMGKEEGEEGPKYNPVITELNEPNYFRWRAHMMSETIFTNYKIIELKETNSGTRLTHTEAFKGLLAPIFCNQMEENVPSMLNSMNKALKQLAEK